MAKEIRVKFKPFEDTFSGITIILGILTIGLGITAYLQYFRLRQHEMEISKLNTNIQELEMRVVNEIAGIQELQDALTRQKDEIVGCKSKAESAERQLKTLKNVNSRLREEIDELKKISAGEEIM